MDPLAHLQTALSDRYRVEKLIGVGGMATVYLARDLRHDRNVALKLLKPELGAVLGVERFLSEIRVTANLQHPHLLPLFDSGEADGLLYYVMPFVEGESLRGRLDREKQLPVNEAIRITVAVAGALDYAHRHNVVHRDLKPENILLQDGQPVVSDFGIALAVTNAGGTRVTQTGLSLGTPQYMSPEQATGDRVIDNRSDIYSLAAVLYEMLIGEPPHTGATIQAIIARVLTDKPRSVRATREMVPENVDAAITRALAKLPADRFATAHQFAEALQDSRYSLPIPVTTSAAAAATAPVPMAAGMRGVAHFSPWAVAVGAVLVAAWSLTRKPEAPVPPPTRFFLGVPDSMPYAGGVGDLAVSRDGRFVAIAVIHQGARKIALRSMDETGMRVLQGTQGAGRLFFSPDGTKIGYVVDGRLRAVSLAGGGVMTMLSSGATGFAAWTESGIVYTGATGLMKLAGEGGTPAKLTVEDTSADEAHVLPSPAPGGRVVIVLASRGLPNLAVVQSDGRINQLGHLGVSPVYMESGYVLYNSLEGNLMALPVDRRTVEPRGPPFLVMDGVRVGANAVGLWAASTNGTIVAQRSNSAGSNIVAVDRAGRATPLSDEAKLFRMPRVSPDANQIAMQATATGINADAEIWIFDRRTGVLSRFTTGGGNSDALWSPDGKRIAWAGPGSDTNSIDRNVRPELRVAADIFMQPVDKSSPPEVVYAAPRPQWPWSFTPDGKTIVFDEGGGGTRIKAIDLGAREPRSLVENEFANRLGKLSTDGKWLAYTSNETGRMEVYVRPFGRTGGATQVSVEGGDQPMWSRDGRELFYRDGANMIAVAMTEGSVRSKAVLFRDTFDRSNATNYDVLPNGGFIMFKSVGVEAELTLMVNWLTEINRRARAARQ